jgi:phenylalanyl-tRNA synthetase beta subunit
VEIKSLAEEEIPVSAKLNLEGLKQIAVMTAEDAKGEKKNVLGYVYEISEGWAMELDMGAIVEMAGTFPVYEPLNTYTAIGEDLTFKMNEKKSVQIGTVIKKMKGLNELVKKVELKDIYEQNYTFEISYLSDKKQLETAEIAPVRKAIVEMMEGEYGAELVGQLT